MKKENEGLSIIQCRMARAGLKLGIQELARIVDMSPNTISRFERGENMHRRSVKAIREALEEAGAEFIITANGHDSVAIRKHS